MGCQKLNPLSKELTMKKMMMLLLAGTLICMVGCGKDEDDTKTIEEHKTAATEMSKEELQKKIEELKPLIIEKRDVMTKLIADSFANPDDSELKEKKDDAQAAYEKSVEQATVYAEALSDK
jgi:hypothetical protein